MIKHPKTHFYYTDGYFEYPIGKILEHFTNKMLSYDIEFETYKVDEFGRDSSNNYRPHHKKYPYNNNITYMYSDGKYGYAEDCYKLCFYPSHKLSFEQAKQITSLFCNHDDYEKTNINGDVADVKSWVTYLTFQTSISKEKEKLEDFVMGGRFIVEILLNKLIIELRKEKVEKLIKQSN